MIIKFNCQFCQRSLKVSSELAGKRARCNGCKRIIVIPTLDPVSAAPEVDVEAVAAATLVDQPRYETAPAAKQAAPIKFRCYYCDEEIQASADLAGKQTPCPECRRIVKVPMPVTEDPKDWRKVTPRGPAAGLRRDEQAAPEGAWGTAASASTVSQQALLEAEAIPFAEEGLTPLQKIVRVLLGVAAVLLVVAIALTLLHFRGQNVQRKALNLALRSVGEGASPALGNLAAAEINRAAGEFLLRDGKLDQALSHFKQARARLQAELAAAQSVAERDTLIIDLALSQIELGGTQEEADRGIRLKWEKAWEEIRQTVQKLVLAEARTEALRRVGRKLIRKGQIPLVITLGHQVGLGAEADRPEMLALVGLELARAGHKREADNLAQKAVEFYGPGNARRPSSSPSLIALLVVLEQEAKAEESLHVSVPRPGVQGPPAEIRLGFAEGWACQEKWEPARQIAAASGPASDRVRALVAVAAAAVQKKPDEARACLDLALGILEKESQGKPADPWLLCRLVRQGGRVGLADRVQPIAESIADPGIKARAYLDLTRAGLAGKDKPDPGALAAEAQNGSPRPLILELLSRHNSRHGNSSDVRKAVDAWEPETLRPFGYVGVALGLQDAGKETP
jgi:tetratricopeptide (TPR) repeat protein